MDMERGGQEEGDMSSHVIPWTCSGDGDRWWDGTVGGACTLARTPVCTG
jgi:hypothetical protein